MTTVSVLAAELRSRIHFRTTGLFVCAMALVGLVASRAAFAIEPPRPGEIAQLKREGKFEQRLARAEALGNDRMDPTLLERAIYRAKRQAMVQQGLNPDGILPAPPPAKKLMPTKGNVKIFALLIDFPDYPASGGYSTQPQVDSALFGDGSLIPSNPYPYESLKNYYERSSYNQLHFSGLTLGYYRAGYTRASMGDNPTDAQREQLIKEAIASFDGSVDFSQFDNDGDGKIEYFMVIWTGPNNGWANFWWSYKTNWGDSSYTVDGVKLGFYSWDWAGGDYASVTPVKPFEPYVVMHETGHGLGLPDYYDYDSTVGPNGGAGHLDMMDANWGDHNCFSKWLFEWISPTVVAAGSQTVTLNPSGTSPDAVLIMPGAANTDAFREFFIAQNRYRTGNDPATNVPVSYGKYPADGMLIWHVDARLNPDGTDFAWDNQFTSHKLLKLMQADGLDRIETSSATVDAPMYYQPGNSLGPLTVPASNNYLGVDTGVNVTGITRNDALKQISATFSIDNPRVLPTLTVVKAGNGSGTVTSGDGGIDYGTDNAQSYASGTKVTLTAVPAPGSRFLGWSGGGLSGAGPATLSVTADTSVTATFTTTLLLDEDFDPVYSSLPSGWTRQISGGGAWWWFDTTGYNNTGGSGGYALGASYAGGPYDAELRTYSMNASAYTSLGLEFKTSIEDSGSTADVDVSVNGAAGPWTNVWENFGTFTGPQTVDVDLTATAAGHNNVMLRFRHYGTGIWWVIDDVKVMAAPRVSTGSSIPSRFGKGALLATQTRPTGFGDNLSELDQLFGTSDGGNLRLGITGNLENNSNNGIIILLDTNSGGSNPFNYGAGDASLRIQGLNGDTLDNGFNPDYAIDTNLSGGTMFADLYDLQAAPNGKTFLGSVTAPGTAGFTGGGEMSFDNSNTAGVTGADATNAATATTGLEISLPLSRIGNPGGPVKVMVLIQANGNYHSNQTLPGLPDTYGNLGGGAQNYANIPGRQYVTITPAWTASDLGLSQLPWTFEDRVFTGDSSLDNHPPVVNPPTIYNGRAYVVEDVEHYGGSHTGNLVAVKTVDGTLDTTFGTNGRVALSGPAAGRVTIRSVGGVVRLFVATSNGTLYSMDATNGGNVHSFDLGGTTSSTPAVVSNGTTATAYVPVNTAGSWQLKEVDDTTSMSQNGSLTLIGVTEITSSPSVIADGSRVQIAGSTATGGVVYTLSSDLSTVFTAATTGSPVKAPPTLASDSTRFYVGDTPASGNGAFYCFNASTGAQIGSVGISGGLEYAPFGDYSLGGITNALYFATNTGQLNAVNPSTLTPLAGYPATPMGLEPATGAVVLFNGNLYVPTAKGMFAVPSAAPTSFARFPVEGQASTPSSAGRVTGSVMATTLASGLVGGLAVQ